MFNKKKSDQFEVFSDQWLKEYLEGLDWDWANIQDHGVEIVKIKNIHDKSKVLSAVIINTLSKKPLTLGAYRYKIWANNILRENNAVIRQPYESKLNYTVRKIKTEVSKIGS